jgi:hypothetical protein
VLFKNDIDKKIEKTKSHLSYLSNSQSHRITHGGKRFRARQISLQEQVQSYSERLSLLTSAKKNIVQLNLSRQIVEVSKLAQQSFGFNHPPAKSYTQGEPFYTSIFGGRKITIFHADY